MLSDKDYCDYETSVALKELGYDGCCAAYYHLYDDEYDARNSFEYACGFDFQNSNNIYRVGAPLLYQAQKWLREEKDFIVLVDHILTEDGDWCYNITHLGRSAKVFKSYEEALSEGVKCAVKLLKEK